MVPETERQPSREYVESLQQLKDALSELEGKQPCIASGLSEPSKVESALQQAKVTLPFALSEEVTPLLSSCSPALLSVGYPTLLRGVSGMWVWNSLLEVAC